MAQLSSPLTSPVSPRRARTGVQLRHLGVNLIFYAIMSALALAFLAPLLWMVTASLKPEYLVLAIPPTFLPRHFQWENYGAVLSVIPIFAFNSFKLAFLTVGGVLLITPLAAYAFARLDFWGRDFAFPILLATLIPLYIIYRNIGWIDTHYPLWVPKVLHSVTAIFLLRQFFRQIPMDLEDAARLDGASTFQVYWRIMLPQVKPALAAVGIFAFLESWNDLFGPLIFLNTLELQTLPVALKLLQGEFFTQISVLMAGATLSIIPVLIVFFATQKYFLQGITMTGIN